MEQICALNKNISHKHKDSKTAVVYDVTLWHRMFKLLMQDQRY